MRMQIYQLNLMCFLGENLSLRGCRCCRRRGTSECLIATLYLFIVVTKSDEIKANYKNVVLQPSRNDMARNCCAGFDNEVGVQA